MTKSWRKMTHIVRCFLKEDGAGVRRKQWQGIQNPSAQEPSLRNPDSPHFYIFLLYLVDKHNFIFTISIFVLLISTALKIFSLISKTGKFCKPHGLKWASLLAQTVKNLPAMQENGVRSLGWEDPLGKGMATRSSILAWRISWTEEPCGLQSMGSQSWTRPSN